MMRPGRIMRLPLVLVVFAGLTNWVTLGIAQEGKIVPYVPTPQEVSTECLN